CHTEGSNCYTTQSPFFGLWMLANSSTIFIAPNGLDSSGNGTTNNAFWYNNNGQDETFTDDILKAVEADLCIDTSRVELEGFSMGGAMTETLLCSHAGVFRAGGTHSAVGQGKLTP